MEYFSLHISSAELPELYRALLARFLVEDTVRRERGLEPIDPPPALERIERLLGLSEEAIHKLFHEEEASLWEYAWDTFTDEWAYMRAKIEVQKELGSKSRHTSSKIMEDLIEKRYVEHFDQYIRELDIQKTAEKKKRVPKRRG
jgi:hypothetical protein